MVRFAAPTIAALASLVLVVPVGSSPAFAGPVPAQIPVITPEPDQARWRHPVDARIVDFFRAPSGPYSPGNRGLEYDTQAGQVVVAVAAGTVTFAGLVGGQRFVVVAHSLELRSTYAYLADIEVSIGDVVVGGQPLATAARHFHLTARLRNRYVDPLGYLVGSWSVRLVPVGPGRGLVG